MSDIVERLQTHHVTFSDMDAAAARIKQLEAALRENDIGLRLLVDIVWQHATESTAVPFTKTADMLIAKYRAALVQSSPPARQENDDVYPGFRGNNEA